MLHPTKKQDTQKNEKMCTSVEIKTPPNKTLTFTEPLPLSTLAKNHQERQKPDHRAHGKT